MTIASYFFLGFQIASVVLVGVILFEHHRLWDIRKQLLEHLGDTNTGRRRFSRYALTVLYLVTTAVIVSVSTYGFFL